MSSSNRESEGRVSGELARLRTNLHLTQEQLAERSGLSVRTVRNLERGQVETPRWASVRLVARALGVSEAHLAKLLTARGAPGAPLAPTGRNALPPVPGDFTGRRRELSRGVALLRTAARPGVASARILNITGRPGVGKTALALALGHRARLLYPDGQLFAELRGARATPTPSSEALADLLVALGVHPGAVPDSVTARTVLFRQRSADGARLVVLDDALDEAQVAPLLPSAPGSALLVTSRRPLAGLAGVRVLDVDSLSPAESVELLRNVIGPDRADAEPEELQLVASSCAGLPLALRVAGARLVARPTMPVGALALSLSDEGRRLDELRHADLEVRSTLGLACASVSERQRLALALLGRLDVATVSSSTVVALADLSEHDAQSALEALVDARLVDVAHADALGATRYRLHDLVRLFARELAVPQDVQVEAWLRVAGRWLTLAGTADAALPTTSDVVIRGATPRAAVAPEDAERVRREPFAWFASEEENLATFVEQLASAGLTEPAWELAAHVRTYAMIRNRWDVWRRTHRAALVACEEAADVRGAASMRYGLGKLRQETHEAAGQEPTELFAAAGDFDELGERGAQALALCELASWYTWKDDLLRAEQVAREAVDLAREASSAAVLVDALFVLARDRARRSSWAEARSLLREALDVCTPLGKPRSEAQLLWQLAVVARGEGDAPAALPVLRRALRLSREAREHRGQIVMLIELAEVCAGLGRAAEAFADLDEALELCAVTDEKSLRAKALARRGRLLVDGGRVDEGRFHLEQAAALWGGLGNVARMREVEAVITAID